MTMRSLITYRKQLDHLTSEQIVWTPYGRPADLPSISLYHGCIRFMDYIETYMPDRASRQFSRIQGIPRPILMWTEETRLTDSSKMYRKKYGDNGYWVSPGQHCFAPSDLGEEAIFASQSTPDYLDWFVSRSHVRIHNPIHGRVDVNTNTMFFASQQRLQPLRQEAYSLSQQCSQDPAVPDYVRQRLDNIRRLAGTGGLPGVQTQPMEDWFGPSYRKAPREYEAGPSTTWTQYPAYTTHPRGSSIYNS